MSCLCQSVRRIVKIDVQRDSISDNGMTLLETCSIELSETASQGWAAASAWQRIVPLVLTGSRAITFQTRDPLVPYGPSTTTAPHRPRSDLRSRSRISSLHVRPRIRIGHAELWGRNIISEGLECFQTRDPGVPLLRM